MRLGLRLRSGTALVRNETTVIPPSPIEASTLSYNYIACNYIRVITSVFPGRHGWPTPCTVTVASFFSLREELCLDEPQPP